MKSQHTDESRQEDAPVRFGNDYYIEFKSESGQTYEIQVWLRWYPYRDGEYVINTVDSFSKEDTLNYELLKEQKKKWDNFYLVLAVEGPDAAHPKYVKVFKIGDIPLDCFVLRSTESSRNDLVLKHGDRDWVPIDDNFFGIDFSKPPSEQDKIPMYIRELNKLRKGKV